MLELHHFAHGEMREVGKNRLGLLGRFGGGVDFFDGGADQVAKATEGLGVEGNANRTDSDVNGAAITLRHVSEVVLSREHSFGGTHEESPRAVNHPVATDLQLGKYDKNGPISRELSIARELAVFIAAVPSSKKCLRPRGGRHRLPAMVRNAYSYWFGFWHPFTTGRGAIL